jgi:hypothetical protein
MRRLIRCCPSVYTGMARSAVELAMMCTRAGGHLGGQAATVIAPAVISVVASF